MADRRFTELKAQVKLADAQAKAALAAAEVEKAKANAERVRGETERARLKEERETRLATEDSARKTREANAKIASDKRTVENEHLAGAILGGLAAGKITAKLVGKAAEKRMARLAPEAKALAKEARAALQGTGTKNQRLLKGIAEVTPHGRGSLGLGAAGLLLADAALGFYQSGKMREQGDEDAARNLETFGRANAIAGAAVPALRWDQERSASKFLDLKSQAILKATKLAAEAPAGPEPKAKRSSTKPKKLAPAAPTAEQKAITAPDKTLAPQGEPKLALPAPETVKAPAGPAKAAGPTKAELQAAAKQAFAEHPNPEQLRKKMGAWYKYDKNALAAAMRDAKIRVPGFGLKYAAALTAGTAVASALMGAGTSEAKSFSGRLADAGTALKEAAPDLAEGGVETAAMMVPGGQLGVAAYEGAKAAYNSQDARAVARSAASGDLKNTVRATGTLAYDNTVGQAEWLMRQNAGQDFGGRGHRNPNQAPVKAGDVSRPRGTMAPQDHPAHEHVQGYWANRGGKRVFNRFSQATLAARASTRGGM